MRQIEARKLWRIDSRKRISRPPERLMNTSFWARKFVSARKLPWGTTRAVALTVLRDSGALIALENEVEEAKRGVLWPRRKPFEKNC